MIPQVPGNSPIDSSACVGSSSHVPVTAQQTEQSREQRVGATVSTRLPSSSTSSSSFRSPSLTPFSPASSSSWPSPSTKSPRKPVLKNRGDFGSSVLRSVVATGIDLVLGNAETRIPEKRGLVDAAKAIMRENLPDHPQFIALVEMLNLIIFPKILERLEEHSHDKIALSLLERQELLKEMIAINLAQGFANLSKKMSNSRTSSSSLVDLILTLCQAGSCRINAKQLATIEERSRSHRASFRHLRRELLPSLVSRQNHLIESFLIKYSIVANSPSRHDVEIQKQQKAKETIIRDLFSELSPTMPDHVRQDFLEQLEKRDSNPENRNQLSLQLAEKIVNNLIHEYIQSSDSTRKSSIENSLFNTTDHTASKITFINSLNEMHGHQKRLRKIFESVAGEILKELFPLEANSLTLPSSLVPKGYLYDEIKKFLTNFLLQTYEPLENDLARNAEWEAELRSRVGGQDLSLFMHTPAALLVGFTKHFIQTSPDAVGSIAEFLGAQLVPPVPQEPETFPRADEERARKQQLLLAQLTQNQLAEWIIDSIRILLHSEDSLGLGDFAKRACGNLTLALMAKGTELAFSEEASSASSSSGRQINEDLFFKELADRITPKLQNILGNSKISDQFWKELVKDLPIPQFFIDLLMPWILKKAKDLQENLHLQPASFPVVAEETPSGQRRDTKAILLSYKGGSEIIGILDKLTKKIVEKAIESNLGLITELGWQDEIEELMDIYLPGLKVTEELKRWFSKNVSALGIGTEEASSQSIGLLKRGISTVLQEAVINIIQQNFGDSSENYAAQLLSKIHTAFRKAFANYDDPTTRQQIMDGQAIQAEIRKLQSDIEELKQKNARLRKQGSEQAAALSSDQKAVLESLEKAKLRYCRGENSTIELNRKLDKALAKLNEVFPDLPLMVGLFQSLLMDNKPLFQKIITALQNPEQFIEREEEKALINLLEMPSEQLQLLSEVLNLFSTLRNGQKELRTLSSELAACEQAYVKINSQEMAHPEIWQSVGHSQEIFLTNRQIIAQKKRRIEELTQDLDPLLSTFKVLSRELTALLGLEEKEKLNLPKLLRDKIWPIIESAKEGSIARLLFMHITPLILPIFNIPHNRQRLQELAQGDAFLNQLSHTVAERVIARIPDFIISYKPFAKELLVLMGIEEPSFEAIQRMEKTLQEVLTESGKNSITASMLAPIVEEHLPSEGTELLRMSGAFQQLTTLQGFRHFTQQAVLEILSRNPAASTPLRPSKNKARALAKALNQLLLLRGKVNLAPQGLINIYISQLSEGQPIVSEVQKVNIVEAMQMNRFVERMKDVVITPEEIAENLNHAIPGARELHTLIAPELQAVIVGEDPAFQENRGMIQQYVEGMLLRILIKIAEANQIEGQDILAVLTSKLRVLMTTRCITDHSSKEALFTFPVKISVSREGSDALVFDEGVAPAIPKEKNRADDSLAGDRKLTEKVNKASKEIVHSMIDTLIKDIIGVNGKEDFKGIPIPLQQLAYEKLKKILCQQMAPYIIPIVECAQTHARLDQLSGSPFLSEFSQAISKDILNLLPKKLTPADIAAMVKKSLPNMDNELQQGILALMQTHLAEKSIAYENLSECAERWVDGIISKVLLRVAKKNPAKDGKDTLIIATEKLLGIATRKYQAARTRSIAEVASELEEEIMIDIFDIDSHKAFEGVPEWLQHKIYDLIKGQLAGNLIRLEASRQKLKSDDPEVQKARAGLKDFDPAEYSGEAYGHLMGQLAGQFVINSLAEKFNEMGAEGLTIANTISKSIEKNVTELARGNLNVARVLLNYTQGVQLQTLLGESLQKIADPKALIEDKKRGAEFIGNLMNLVLNKRLHDWTAQKEERKFNIERKLIQSLLEVAVGHIKILNDAKEMAKEKGRTEISHAEFVAAAGARIHPAVQTGSVDFNPEAYGPCANLILEAFLPNGPEDELLISLTPGLDKGQRTGLWKLAQKALPSAIPMIIENLFNPDMLDQIIVKTLEATRDTMNQQIILGEEEPADRPLDAIDEVSGALIAELMRTLKLPEWVKKKIAPAGLTTTALKRSMGAAIRKKFNGKFIKEMIPKAFLSAIKKNNIGKAPLDFIPKAVRQAEMPQKRVQMQADLKRLSREVIDSSISYFIRKQWALFQKQFDELIERLFGHLIGLNTKRLLDAIFRIIFFKIIGSALSVLLWPMKKLIKEAIYRFASLDENRDLILGLLKNIPADQPAANYVVYNEDLAFKLVEAIQTSFK